MSEHQYLAHSVNECVIVTIGNGIDVTTKCTKMNCYFERGNI